MSCLAPKRRCCRLEPATCIINRRTISVGQLRPAILAALLSLMLLTSPSSNAFQPTVALPAVSSSRARLLHPEPRSSHRRRSFVEMLPSESFGWLEASAAASSSSSAASSSSLWPSFITCLIPNTTPAHGHTQPLWGPPDPYLTAGKSIAPPNPAAAALVMGTGDGSSSTTGSNMITPGTPDIPEELQQAITKEGWKVLDASKIQAETVLPGFAKTGGILAQHSPALPAETPETFAAQVEWSANFMNIIDKLPYAAFAYALIEFFLIRPNLDVYRQDVQEERAGVLAETVGATVVRLGVFALCAAVTTSFFG